MFSKIKVVLILFIIQRISAKTISVNLSEGDVNQFDNLVIIGRGATAVVFQGEWVEEAHKIVALKMSISRQGDIEMENEVKLYKHIGVLKGDPNSEKFKKAVEAGILEVYDFGSVTTSDFKEELVGFNVLIMELTGMNLYEATTEMVDNLETRVKLSPTEWLQIGLEMFRATRFLHSIGIIYGDIKSDNFAPRSGKSLGIFDFGAARMTNDIYTGIAGSLYFYGLLQMNLFLQYKNWLPGNIAPLQHVPGLKEDLECTLMAFYDIQIIVEWYKYLEDYNLYIQADNYGSNPLALKDERKLKAYRMTQTERDNLMKTALIDMLKSKKQFPDQIQSILGPVLQQTSGLEKVEDAIGLFKEIVLYARSHLMLAQSETKEQIVAQEDEFLTRWTQLLESWKKTNPVEKSMLKSKTDVE